MLHSHPSIHPSLMLYKFSDSEHLAITHLKTLTATASSTEDAVGKLLNVNVCYGFVLKCVCFNHTMFVHVVLFIII
jgi:hypothetical protein